MIYTNFVEFVFRIVGVGLGVVSQYVSYSVVCFIGNVDIGVFEEFCYKFGLTAHICECGPFRFGLCLCVEGFVLCCFGV